MDHGRTSDVHDHANVALSNPILLWRCRKREGRGLATALLLLARTTTGTTPLRRAATSATAASTTSTSATSASAASTAATDASTPATTPTTTPAPSTASTTTTSTAPASPTGTSAPLALAGAGSPARGRRSADRLETTEVGRSSRGNRG
ncbi:unnamed protein product [Closterium sp. NIES-53]